MESGFPSRWQVRRYLIHKSSKEWVLHSTAGQGVVVFDDLRLLCRILMPFQLELNEVTPLTTHSNYGVELLLYEDFPNTFMLERRGIFTRDLSGATVRSVEEQINAGI